MRARGVGVGRDHAELVAGRRDEDARQHLPGLARAGAAERAPLFYLEMPHAAAAGTNCSIAALHGTSVKLDDEAGTPLSDTLGTDALAEGLVTDVAKITANAASSSTGPDTRKARTAGLSSWAILDSNQGPLPYQRSALTD